MFVGGFRAALNGSLPYAFFLEAVERLGCFCAEATGGPSIKVEAVGLLGILIADDIPGFTFRVEGLSGGMCDGHTGVFPHEHKIAARLMAGKVAVYRLGACQLAERVVQVVEVNDAPGVGGAFSQQFEEFGGKTGLPRGTRVFVAGADIQSAAVFESAFHLRLAVEVFVIGRSARIALFDIAERAGVAGV